MVRAIIFIFLFNCSANLFSQERQIAVAFDQPAELTGNAGQDLAIYEDFSYTVGNQIETEGGTPEYNYKWVTPSADTIPSNTFILVNSPGTYYLLVTDGNNCAFIDSLTVSYATATGQVQNPLPQIYPNPANEYLHYRINTGNAPAGLSLMNAAGQVILSTVIAGESGITEGDLDIKGVPPGTYIMHVTTSLTEYADKLIIKR